MNRLRFAFSATVRAALAATIVASTLVPYAAGAHTASGEAFVFVDGQDTISNSLTAISATTNQDLAPVPYTIKTPIKLTVDEDAFGDGAVFRWIWGGQSDDTWIGAQTTKSYDRPGSYSVLLQVKTAGAKDFTDADTIGLNVIPVANYALPKAKIKYSSRKVSGGIEVTYRADATVDPTSSAQFYGWEFGDGSTDSGQVVTHVYKGDVAVTPYFKVTDDNDITTELAFSLKVTKGHLSVGNLPQLPGIVEPLFTVGTWILIALGSLVGLGILVGIVYLRVRRRSQLQPVVKDISTPPGEPER